MKRPLPTLFSHGFNFGDFLLRHPAPLQPLLLLRRAADPEEDDVGAARARHRVREDGHPVARRAVVAVLVQGDHGASEVGYFYSIHQWDLEANFASASKQKSRLKY